MAKLQLAVNGEYFDQMKSGEKVEEYRMVNPYWFRRLSHGHNQQLPRRFDRLIITRGFPKRDEQSKRIDIPYNGYEVKVITHPHFGPDPVKVFAIRVNIDGQLAQTAANAPPQSRCSLVDGRSAGLEADRAGARGGNRQAQKASYPRADAGSHAEGDGPPALLHRNKKMSYLQ